MAVPPSISIAFCFSMPHCKHDLHMNQTICEFCLPSLHYHKLMTYGERLQKAMDERGVDRKTLAKAIDVTPHAIGMAITGGGREERWLSRENNGKAAKYLKVDAHWLFTGEGQMLVPTGAVHGALTFTGQATGEHMQNKHQSHADGSGVATNFVAEKPLGVYAMAVGRLFDKLTDEQQTLMLTEITTLITKTLHPTAFEPLKEPAPVVLPGKQRV